MRLSLAVTLAVTLALSAAGADTDTGAVEVTTTVPSLPPKVAVVVAGDPDASLRATASEIEGECTSVGLRTPVDPTLRAAMRGEPGAEEDGLGGLRSIRRSLGVDPRKDLASYKRLGAIAGADALIVLRREGTIKLEVFDVSASQFYEGLLEVAKTTPEDRMQYIDRRAKPAQQRWTQDPGAAAAAAGGQILVSSTTAGLVNDSEFEFGTPLTFELKGLDGTHQLQPLNWS